MAAPEGVPESSTGSLFCPLTGAQEPQHPSEVGNGVRGRHQQFEKDAEMAKMIFLGGSLGFQVVSTVSGSCQAHPVRQLTPLLCPPPRKGPSSTFWDTQGAYPPPCC